MKKFFIFLLILINLASFGYCFGKVNENGEQIVYTTSLYHKTVTLVTSTDTNWNSHTITSDAVAININTDQSAYIAYDTTANYFLVENSDLAQLFYLPYSITTLYWKHLVTGNFYLEELERR